MDRIQASANMIIELAGSDRNVKEVSENVYRLCFAGGISLIRMSDGKTVRFSKFSFRDDTRPDSAKTGIWPWSWEPMNNFIIPPSEFTKARTRAASEVEFRAKLARSV